MGFGDATTNETARFQLQVVGQQDVALLTSQMASLRSMLTLTAATATAFWAGNRLIGGLENATSAAVEFESKLSSVRKTTGLSGQGLGLLKDRLTDLATSFGGFKIGELFDVAAMGGRLGIAGNKIGDFARDIGMIRVALEDIPAEQAATDIARILNVFKIGSGQAINFASALNKLDDTSTATGRDILDITQRIAGSAASLGIAPQKVLALSAALKDAGVNNEVAGTAIAQVFGRMESHADKFAQIAGVGFQRFAMTLRADPLAALMLFEKGLRRLDGATQLQVLENMDLDGMRVKGTLLQLGSVIGKLPDYIRTANKEWGSLASILKENEIAGNTTEGQLNRMRAAYDKIAMQVGESTLPVVKAFAGSMVELSGNLGEFLKSHEATFSKLSDWLTAAARSAGLFVSEFALFVRLGKEFALDKFEQLSTVLARIGDQAGANLSTGVSNGVQLIRNTFAGLGTYLSSFFDQLGGVLASHLVRSVARSIDSLIPDVLMKALRVANPIMAAQLDQIRGMKDAPVQGFAPDASGFGAAAMGRGIQAMPGFVNPMANLPGNAHGDAVVAILDEIRAARAKADARANEQKKGLLPVGNTVANPFVRMTPRQRAAAARGQRSNAARLAKQRKAMDAKQRAAQIRRGGFGARVVPGAASPGPNTPAAALAQQRADLAQRQALLQQAQEADRKRNVEAAANRAARVGGFGPQPMPAPRQRPPGWRGPNGHGDQAVGEKVVGMAGRQLDNTGKLIAGLGQVNAKVEQGEAVAVQQGVQIAALLQEINPRARNNRNRGRGG